MHDRTLLGWPLFYIFGATQQQQQRRGRGWGKNLARRNVLRRLWCMRRMPIAEIVEGEREVFRGGSFCDFRSNRKAAISS